MKRTLLCTPLNGRLRESNGEWYHPATAEQARREEWRDAQEDTLATFEREFQLPLTPGEYVVLEMQEDDN